MWIFIACQWLDSKKFILRGTLVLWTKYNLEYILWKKHPTHFIIHRIMFQGNPFWGKLLVFTGGISYLLLKLMTWQNYCLYLCYFQKGWIVIWIKLFRSCFCIQRNRFYEIICTHKTNQDTWKHVIFSFLVYLLTKYNFTFEEK